MTTVKMFVIAGDHGCEALAAEVARMPDCCTEVYTCPKTIESIQPMPFIQVDGSERFYGKEGIESFLAKKAASR
ncbi:MAG: hypothetical protein NTU94_18610 [Planctomycetota bacterium]|nr:hypothetical protein [Planctomycetota bacterium]